ncbi:hypothetical protein BC936DRAFT_144178 [Jimgerdemannia flammicorona]|uniref:Uncharacterized protein n=2 Tax=Jimgerdemannia flammicorona TaxID=994334 RepID=A0A433DCY1_9FUNG|nr:hypothetical protein BC936DRAFT_144178 [Jimgerdemannia flammicorona]RUS34141.1 hypothetical protein BC938DRAFT_482288 [Jimgerdemannia flammicorona]
MALLNRTPYKNVESRARTIVTYLGPLHVDADRGPRKVPVPLDSAETFLYQHFPLEFTITSSTKRHTTDFRGFLYLTNRRIVLLADYPTRRFESFAVNLAEITGFRYSYRDPRTVGIHFKTADGKRYRVELAYRPGDEGRCKLLTEFLEVIVEGVTSRKQKLDEAITSVSVLRDLAIGEVELPPSYGEVVADALAAAYRGQAQVM